MSTVAKNPCPAWRYGPNDERVYCGLFNGGKNGVTGHESPHDGSRSEETFRLLKKRFKESLEVRRDS